MLALIVELVTFIGRCYRIESYSGVLLHCGAALLMALADISVVLFLG